MIQDLAISVVFILYAISVLMGFGTILTWVERKQAAVMSDRIGANRAYIRIPFTQVKLVWWGLFHGIADEDQRIVGDCIGFAQQNYARRLDLVAAGAHDLRLAAQRVGILDLAAVAVTGVDGTAR